MAKIKKQRKKSSRIPPKITQDSRLSGLHEQISQKRDKDERQFSCPRCSWFGLTKMEKMTHPSGALLDICPKCGGMWIDKDEVKVLYDYSARDSARVRT